MARKTAAQLDREIKAALVHCPDCNRPFDPVARRHVLDSNVNRFLIPGCCAVDYRAANPAWKPTRPVHATKGSGRSVAVDKLLERMKLLEEKHVDAREELRLAGRASDGVYDDETHGHPVTPARKAAAERRWADAVRAERALTTKMRKIVLKIRVIDPTRVPWGWQNTR